MTAEILNMWRVIENGSRYRGISDDQVQNERAAQAALEIAKAEMRRAILLVNNYSSLQRIEPEVFENFVSDELPSVKAWEEAISEARNV